MRPPDGSRAALPCACTPLQDRQHSWRAHPLPGRLLCPLPTARFHHPRRIATHAGLPVQLVRGSPGRNQGVPEAQWPVHGQHRAAGGQPAGAGHRGSPRRREPLLLLSRCCCCCCSTAAAAPLLLRRRRRLRSAAAAAPGTVADAGAAAPASAVNAKLALGLQPTGGARGTVRVTPPLPVGNQPACLQGTVYWAAKGQGAFVQREGQEAQRMQVRCTCCVELSRGGPTQQRMQQQQKQKEQKEQQEQQRQRQRRQQRQQRQCQHPPLVFLGPASACGKRANDSVLFSSPCCTCSAQRWTCRSLGLWWWALPAT